MLVPLTVPPYGAASYGDAVQYMCELHNVVNERLVKPVFDCAQVSVA